MSCAINESPNHNKSTFQKWCISSLTKQGNQYSPGINWMPKIISKIFLLADCSAGGACCALPMVSIIILGELVQVSDWIQKYLYVCPKQPSIYINICIEHIHNCLYHFNERNDVYHLETPTLRHSILWKDNEVSTCVPNVKI